jgi:hypothetical protein
MSDPVSVVTGAYATSPRLSRRDDGPWTCAGAIERWTGSLAELAAAAAIPMEAGPEVDSRATLTLLRGEVVDYPSLDALADAAPDVPPDSVATVRIEVRDGEALTTTIVARDRLPAVLVDSVGQDRARVFGTAQLVFSRLMRGYSPAALGGWQLLITFLISFSPLPIAIVATGNDLTNWSFPARIALVSGILASTMALFLLVPKVLKPLGPALVVVAKTPDRGPTAGQRLRALYQHRWTQRVLYVVYALALGVLGNVIADAL